MVSAWLRVASRHVTSRRYGAFEKRDELFSDGRGFSPTVCSIVDTAFDLCELSAAELGTLFEVRVSRGLTTSEVSRACGERAADDLMHFRT